MTHPSNEVLANMIENLADKVETGFSGIHLRQDTTNGKVQKNSESRIQQETSNKWIYGLITLVALPVVFLIVNELIK